MLWLFSKERRCLLARKNISSSFWQFYFSLYIWRSEFIDQSLVSLIQLCHQESDHLWETDKLYFETSKAETSWNHIRCHLESPWLGSYLASLAPSLLSHPLTTRPPALWSPDWAEWAQGCECFPHLLERNPFPYSSERQKDSLVRMFREKSRCGVKSHDLSNL